MAELEQDDSIKAQEELNSAYKREEFVKKNFKFNAPIEIILNKDEVKLGSIWPHLYTQYNNLINCERLLLIDAYV